MTCHPNCEKHGKSPCEGIQCDGTERTPMTTATATTERPPWVWTPAEKAAVTAIEAILTLVRQPPPPEPHKTSCENHDVAGACDAECLALAQAMSGDGYSEPMVYGDYLGGTSVGYDPSGCHRGPSMPEEEVYLDTDRKAIAWRKVHPDDCDCGARECPQEIRGDAILAVKGDRSEESWTRTEDGWARVE